jgi:hypothetical protein
MKKNAILILLNVICFFVVLIGSFIDNSNSYINIVVCAIIFVSIIVQIIAIISDRKNS